MDTTHNATDTNVEGQYIPKSYQFERDMDTPSMEGRHDSLVFDEDANTHFVHEDMDSLVNTNDGRAILSQMLRVFLGAQSERLKSLEEYSNGYNTTILNGRRRMEKEKSDYRVRHNWGGYISSFITGYVISHPVSISTTRDDKGLEIVEQVNWWNDIDTLNYELAYDASRFGRAFELHYRDTDNNDCVAIIPPSEMFVIRSHTIAKEIIGAVHCPVYNGKMYITVYTAREIIKYQPCEPSAAAFVEAERLRHFYNDVPVVEWWNNRFRRGDFETEISLIDAYDAAQSDTSNYMSDLNDALLVINGDFANNSMTAKDAALMKEHNMLLLETGIAPDGKQTNLTAEYIYKQYDVAGTEAYKNRLINDIYRLANVPNLEDDRFYSGNSGIALQYKMIGLEQIRSTKQSFFTRALRRRYELIANIHRELSIGDFNAKDLVFTFHPNIPEDVWAEIKTYIEAGGEVSQETLREIASFTDHQTEEERMRRESVTVASTDEERAFLETERDLIE